MMYNVVFIDLDDTLFDFPKAERNALDKSIRYFGYKGDFDRIRRRYKVINDKLWEDLEKGLTTTAKLKLDRFVKLIEECNLDYDPQEFCNKYTEFLGQGFYLIEGAEQLCKYLKSKGYKVVIVTNGIKSVQHSRLEGSGIKDYIDDIVISEEVGVSKPDPKIFDIAMDKLGHSSKEDIIMIGDSLTSDMRGAVNAGIDACWLNMKNKQNNMDFTTKHEVHSLKEIQNLL